MSWFGFLFRWDGRIRGGQLLGWSFGVSGLSSLASIALVMAFVPQDPVHGGWYGDARFWSFWYLGQLPGAISSSSLTARRLHDLGSSALWLIPILVYGALLHVVALIWPDIDGTWVVFVLALPLIVVLFWLIGAPGDKHDNRFGPVTVKD